MNEGAYRGVRVAVLGATGFIGRWVAHILSRRRATLFLVVRDRATAEEIFARYDVHGEIWKADARDPEAVVTTLTKVRPSITFNLLGYAVDRSEDDERLAYQINAQAVAAICEAVAQQRDLAWRGRDVVHAGSAAEYGSVRGRLSEDSVPSPITTYGKSKLAGTCILERCSRALGIKGLTARLFTVYGPGEHHGRLLPSLLEAARMGGPLPLTAGDQERDFTYVEDVAEGLLRLGLTTGKPGETVNLATGRLTPVRSFVETAAGILQVPVDRLRFGSISVRADEMECSEVGLDRLRELTGWMPTTEIAEGIRRTLDFVNARSKAGH